MALKKYKGRGIKLKKEDVILSISVLILFLTALIDWNLYSWAVLAAIILIIAAWYSRIK